MSEALVPDLREPFMTRVVRGLVANNVCRGAWAEELVSQHLGGVEFTDQWSRFDLTWRGSRVSAKHSTSRRERFGVRRSTAARRQDPSEPGTGEWMVGAGVVATSWCDLSVVASRAVGR